MSKFPEGVLEYFVDGTICVDRSGVVTTINQAACELLQVSSVRIVNKKKIEDIIQVDGEPFNLALTRGSEPQSQVTKVSSSFRKPFEARLVTIPFAITENDLSILVIKDLSHEEELFQKYQGQMQMKDRKIYESQLLNSILQNIRITKDPHSMIRQIALTIMKEVQSDASLMVTVKSNRISCDIVTKKENREKFVNLLVARDIPSECFKFDEKGISCLPKAMLPEPLRTIWPTDQFCLLNLYEGHESIILLITIRDVLSEENLTLIKTIRDQTSLSISSSHFEKLSHIDELTNVYNRRYFIQHSKVFFRESALNDKDCSVIIIDLDHFKKINDTDGHLFGDEVLKIVGGLLQQNSRISDIIARYGGEEFIIFLPETNETEANVLAERIRKAIENYEIVKGSSSRFVTASFGIAARLQSRAENLEQLIDNADQALYVSKENGRNRVTKFSPASK
jgi:diguanylate cyclase (GGDEF)-like protein